jgi:hypothetical protein
MYNSGSQLCSPARARDDTADDAEGLLGAVRFRCSHRLRCRPACFGGLHGTSHGSAVNNILLSCVCVRVCGAEGGWA